MELVRKRNDLIHRAEVHSGSNEEEIVSILMSRSKQLKEIIDLIERKDLYAAAQHERNK